MPRLSPNVCPVCERRIATKKNSQLRIMHYINDAFMFQGYKLKPCKGADPHNGAWPSGAAIAESKKYSGIRCLCCDKRVGETKDFRPRKHDDENGRPCRGWSDNQR